MAKEKKETRGRPKNSTKGKEVKVSRPVYMYPSDIKKVRDHDGSLTKGLEIRVEQINTLHPSPKKKKLNAKTHKEPGKASAKCR